MNSLNNKTLPGFCHMTGFKRAVFDNLKSLTDGRRRRHAFCALRGKKPASASFALHQTQGSAPYRSLHPGLKCAAPIGAWRMFGS